jgi:hypothetical protein
MVSDFTSATVFGSGLTPPLPVPRKLHGRLRQHLRRLDVDALVVGLERIEPHALNVLAVVAEHFSKRAADRER